MSIQKSNVKQAMATKKDEVGNRWEMVFNEICKDGIIRPISINPIGVTSIERITPPTDDHKFDSSTAFTHGGTLIIYEGRNVVLYETFELVVPALGAIMTAFDYWVTHDFRAEIEFGKMNVMYSHDFNRT